MVNRRRVVVTGLGVVSSIGIGKEAFWDGLLHGRSGISRIERFDTSKYDVHIGGEVKDFNPESFLDKGDAQRFGRAAQFAIAAMRLGLKDAGLHPETLRGQPVSVCLGTTMAESQAIEAFDDDVSVNAACTPTATSRYAMQFPSCMIGAHAAAYFGFRGRVAMIPTACAAGNYAIAYASDMIRLRKCDIALAGGVDAFSRYAFTGFHRMHALSPDYCRPFDLNRKGTVVGEGAGLLILESFDRAVDRGAFPYAEVSGYGTNCDAHHMTIPTVEGIAEVMRRSLTDAEIPASEIDYISAHGTGTLANDRAESAAILEIFGSGPAIPPVSSIKSMLGHTMGAASALEAIACSLAIRDGQVPPTMNFQTPDPECAVDCVPNVSRPHSVRAALNNSFAFGGNNACVVLRKWS